MKEIYQHKCRFVYVFIYMIFCYSINISVVSGQQADIENLKIWIDSAKNLSWPDNVELLENGLEYLPEDNMELKNKLFFTAAYYYHQQALMAESESDTNFSKAKQYYQQVLLPDPDNVSARNNLVLLLNTKKEYNVALLHLDTLINTDIKNEVEYRITKAEIHLLQKDTLAAYNELCKALYLKPEKISIMRRISSLFDINTNWNTNYELLEFSKRLKDIGYYSISKIGLEKYLKIYSSSGGSRKAYEALLEWTDLLASQNNISVEDFSGPPCNDSIFKGACKELFALAKDPLKGIYQLNWWTYNIERSHYIGRLILKIAIQENNPLTPEQSASLLEEADAIVPRIWEYHRESLHDKHPVILDISKNLALLYYNFPELDPDDRKFRSLEIELFIEKGIQYAENNPEGILRMHTVLGFIYFDREIWRSIHPAKNAVFQLDHAASTACRIEDSNAALYKPIPIIYQRLAIAYDAINERNKAGNAYLEAAMGYMDVDNLDMAAESLKKAESRIHSNKNNQYAEIHSILQYRINLEGIDKITSSDKINRLKQIINEIPVEYQERTTLSNGFKNRQYFKILVDLGQKVSRNTKEDYLPVLAGQALNIISRQSAIGSYDDIIRLQWISQAFGFNLYMKQPEDVINLKPRTFAMINNNIDTKEWQLNSGLSNKPVIVGIDNDLELLGNIYYSVFENESNNAIKQLQNIKINNDVIYINEEGVDESLLERMKQLGVRDTQELKKESYELNSIHK